MKIHLESSTGIFRAPLEIESDIAPDVIKDMGAYYTLHRYVADIPIYRQTLAYETAIRPVGFVLNEPELRQRLRSTNELLRTMQILCERRGKAIQWPHVTKIVCDAIVANEHCLRKFSEEKF